MPSDRKATVNSSLERILYKTSALQKYFYMYLSSNLKTTFK